MTVSSSPVSNPLLIGRGLPPFDQIRPEHVVPAITELLQTLTVDLDRLEAGLEPTWEGLVEPLEELGDRLTWTWGAVNHLMGVKNSRELREAHQAVQPQVIQFITRLNQSQALYQGFKALKAQHWDALDSAQQRIVEAAIRDAEYAGVGLEGEAKERFNAIQLELAELGTQFSNHVLDATKAFALTLAKPEEVEGLPASLKALAAQSAQAAGEENATPESGPWRITLDAPSYLPFMQHSRRRDLREKLYRAYVSRAAAGEMDNRPLIDRILALRQEMAKLLNFDTYAELSLARKMAPSVAAVDQLMEELRSASYDAAKAEQVDLEAFAQSHGEREPLMHWDVAFWAERMREEKYDLNDEVLRPYFPLDQVLNGLFGLAQRLFGVAIAPADGEAPLWHPDVRYFQVADETGTPIAYFYLDPYSRPAEKRGGAWMDDCLNRTRLRSGEIRLPVAYLVCNQSPPVGETPSLMTFREVETLFHEFGHGLQHMLTRVNYGSAAGINNIEWDAVELPSQFMENWCYDRATLMGMARHYQTGEPLPEADYQKLLAARTFRSGSATLRQLHFSCLDLELHHRYQPGGKETPFQVRDRVARTTTVMPPLPEDAFLCAFGHIFAGGYAAGYYSYKWAEVLSADAFAAFEEAGLENEAAIAETGRRFRETVLALGGGQHPMTVFKTFRGREPNTEALLRHSGLRAA